MRKTLAVLAVVIALGVVGWLLFGRDESNPSDVSGGSQANESSANDSANDTGQQTSQNTIDIKNMIFTPSQITVQRGDSVTWTNNDTTAHTVINDLNNTGGPKSGNIEPGETYTFTFNNTGSFQYHCSLHPSMRGTIVVK